MSMQKKFIISLAVLLASCAISTGCEFSSLSESKGTNSPNTTIYAAEASSSNELSEQFTEPSMTVTIAPTPAIPPAKPTAVPTRAPSATKPTTVTSSMPTPTIPAPAISSDIVLDALIGKSLASVTKQFGSPVAKEKSEYGFDWYVYHNNYKNFVMIGIQNSVVVGLYSNSPNLRIENLAVGVTRGTVRKTLGEKYSGPLTSILKGDTEYTLPIQEQRDVFTDGQQYVTFFYDNIKGRVLTAVQVLDFPTEQSFGLSPAPGKAFTDSYEKIGFYLINSIRVRSNLAVLQYDNNMAKVAAMHSQDMIDRSFFNHVNPDGLDFGGRIHAAGYKYRLCSENIAKGCPGAIVAHEGYMNSAGHRDNILGNAEFVGIGVRMGQGSILQTQLFITFP